MQEDLIDKLEEDVPLKPIKYQRQVGIARFLGNTLAVIAYVMGNIGRFNEEGVGAIGFVEEIFAHAIFVWFFFVQFKRAWLEVKLSYLPKRYIALIISALYELGISIVGLISMANMIMLLFNVKWYAFPIVLTYLSIFILLLIKDISYMRWLYRARKRQKVQTEQIS